MCALPPERSPLGCACSLSPALPHAHTVQSGAQQRPPRREGQTAPRGALFHRGKVFLYHGASPRDVQEKLLKEQVCENTATERGFSSQPRRCAHPRALQVRGSANCPHAATRCNGHRAGSVGSKYPGQLRAASRVNLHVPCSFCKYRIWCMRSSRKFLL